MGRGAFGQIILAKRRSTGGRSSNKDVVALKVVPKARVSVVEKEALIRAVGHPFIVQLLSYFETKILEKRLEETKCLKNETEASLLEASLLEVNLLGLQKKLKEKDRERDQMEGIYRDKIMALQKELKEAECLKNETEESLLEANLLGLKKLKEKDREMDRMKAAFRATIIGIEKQLEKTKCLKNKTEASLLEANLLEANLLGLEKKLEEKDRERDHMERTYREKIMALEKELEEAKCSKNEAEAKMYGLEKKLKEKDSERHQMKVTYRDKITVLERRLEEKDRERDQAIRALPGKIEEMGAILREKTFRTEELERKLLNMRDWKKVEKALRGQIKELKQTISLMKTSPSHMKAQADAQQQTDGTYQEEIIPNTQIEELDKKLQEQMSIRREEKRDRKNVERALRGQIKQLKQTISLLETSLSHMEAQMDAQQQTDGTYQEEIIPNTQIEELDRNTIAVMENMEQIERTPPPVILTFDRVTWKIW